MSVRLEYVPATSPVFYVNELALEQLNMYPNAPENQDVLVISYDEAIVLTGTPEELQDLAVRIISAVARGAAPGPKCRFCGEPIEPDGRDVGMNAIWAVRNEDTLTVLCPEAPEGFYTHKPED